MTLEKQLVSLELSQKLKALGVQKHSLYVMDSYGDIYHTERDRLDECETYYPAYSVAELGEMLPVTVKGSRLHYWQFPSGHSVEYLPVAKNSEKFHVDGDTEADARAKMLIYLLEHSLIELL